MPGRGSSAAVAGATGFGIGLGAAFGAPEAPADIVEPVAAVEAEAPETAGRATGFASPGLGAAAVAAPVAGLAAGAAVLAEPAPANTSTRTGRGGEKR